MPPDPACDRDYQGQQDSFIKNRRRKDQGGPMSHLRVTGYRVKVCPDKIPTLRDILIFSGSFRHYHSFPTGLPFNHALSSASKEIAIGSHWLKSSSRVYSFFAWTGVIIILPSFASMVTV